jgi:hypothetical protein
VRKTKSIGVFPALAIKLGMVIVLLSNCSTGVRLTESRVEPWFTEIEAMEFSEHPTELLYSEGYERPTLQDLNHLFPETGIDPSQFGENGGAPDDAASEGLVGLPIALLEAGSLLIVVTPRGSGAEIEQALCGFVTKAVLGRKFVQDGSRYGAGKDPEIACKKNRIEIGTAGLTPDEPSPLAVDWKLLKSTISATGPDRFLMQRVDGRRAFTMEKLADGILGTNSTEENRSRLK